jgi:alcohol dehydrogenase class IV
VRGFLWDDAGRVVLFDRGGPDDAPATLAGRGFAGFQLLSTPRALAGAPQLAAAAGAVHDVPSGQVPEAAAALLGRVGDGPLVAFGGGRVIDTAKALAAISGAAVAAIPTTMSGAEMTAIHRLPAAAEARVRGMVRPRLVLADPEAMTSQPELQLRASSMNALAHGADSLYTPFANPVAEAAALRGAAAIAAALDQPAPGRDRATLALGSLLCGYAIDSAGFGLHHVVCQSLVRLCGSPHAETNAAVLPRVLAFLAAQAPETFAPLAQALDADLGGLEGRVLELGGDPPGLGALGAERTKLDDALEAMLARPELGHVPTPPRGSSLPSSSSAPGSA